MKRKTHDWNKINYSIVQPVLHYTANLHKFEINRGKYASEEVYRKRGEKRNFLRQISLEANFSRVLFPSLRVKWLHEFKWHSYQSIIGIDSVEIRHLKDTVPDYRMAMTSLTSIRSVLIKSKWRMGPISSLPEDSSILFGEQVSISFRGHLTDEDDPTMHRTDGDIQVQVGMNGSFSE